MTSELKKALLNFAEEVENFASNVEDATSAQSFQLRKTCWELSEAIEAEPTTKGAQ